jgi:RNA polymerase sigma-70 factor (ECF subfamily)
MSYPSSEDEMALHQRLLDHDPVAYADVFLMYMDRLADRLRRQLKCDVDLARDAALEAVLAYRSKPERFDSQKGQLFPYIAKVARHKAMDLLSSDHARVRREKENSDVEHQRTTPKEEERKMENSVRARLLVDRLEAGRVLNERDRALLMEILVGDGSTEELARVLDLPPMPKAERQREVKRHRDRLMRKLERFGKKEEKPDDES